MSAKVISFFSNKGGCGKTFIAVNAATVLALEKRKVLLLELNLQSDHDIDKMLNIQCPFGLVNILDQIEEFNKPEMIRKAVTTHASGLDFLPTILSIDQISKITPSRLRAFFEMAGQLYDYIIIDAGRAFSEPLAVVLQHSHLIVLVATPDALSLQKLKWCLNMLKTMNLPPEMIKLVLNRFASHGAMDLQKVTEELNLNILAKIPSHGRTVGLALNRAIPCVMDSSQSPISQSLIELAREFEKETTFPALPKIDKLQLSGSLKYSNELWAKLRVSQTWQKQKARIDTDDPETILKKKIHERLVKQMNVDHVDPGALSDKQRSAEMRAQGCATIIELLKNEKSDLIKSEDDLKRLANEIATEVFGLGVLEEYLEDEEISDIMVNGQHQIFVEKRGKLIHTNAKFVSERHTRAIIDRILAPLGRRIDESTPMVDARLADGSRVNAIIPPLSLVGPVITIRKFGRVRPTTDDLLTKYQSLNADMHRFLHACVQGRKNIIVSGGTGSGKTTLLNIISTFIPDGERVITIEDAAELRINKKHWIRLESRPANIEGRGRVPIRTLFVNSLHMRPDRIIVGECRGAEVLDMLQAMNTGHNGSMTTLHANSTKDVLVRMSSMILLAGVDLPIRAIHEMISTALDIIVHVNRFADGSRKIVQITEVTGLNEDHYLQLNDIFNFEQKGLDANGKVMGNFVATGYVPKCYEEFRITGIPVDKEIFTRKDSPQ